MPTRPMDEDLKHLFYLPQPSDLCTPLSLGFFFLRSLLQSDLVSPDTLDDVVAQVRAINAVAELRCTKRSNVDLGWILDTKCFSPELALAVDPSLAPNRGSAQGGFDGSGSGVGNAGLPKTDTDGAAIGAHGNEHAHAGGDGQHAGHGEHSHKHVDGEDCDECAEASVEGPGGIACSVHDPLVTTCAVDLIGSLDLPRLERWLGGLLWDQPPGGTEVYRVKGVVSVEGKDERFVVQGVADLFEVAPVGVEGSGWGEDETRRCKVVFIGRLLSKASLERGVRSCMIQG